MGNFLLFASTSVQKIVADDWSSPPKPSSTLRPVFFHHASTTTDELYRADGKTDPHRKIGDFSRNCKLKRITYETTNFPKTHLYCSIYEMDSLNCPKETVTKPRALHSNAGKVTAQHEYATIKDRNPSRSSPNCEPRDFHRAKALQRLICHRRAYQAYLIFRTWLMKGNAMNIIRTNRPGISNVAGIAALLLLSACGGGGGGGGGASAPDTGTPAATLSQISASSSTQVASNAYAANGSIGNSSGGASSLLTGVSVDGAVPGVVTPALALFKRAYANGAPALLTGVSTTQACAGGGTIAVNGTMGTNGPANGDNISVTASNCVENGATINGALTMAFSNISGDLSGSGAGAVTIDATFTSFSVAVGTSSTTVTGDMKLVVSQTSTGNVNLAISGASLQSVELKAGVKVSDFRLSNYRATIAASGTTVSVSANYALAGTFGSLGQVSVNVKTLQPFVADASGVPSAGSLIVNGAASSVTATVVPANKVRLDYSAKGDGVITQTNTLDWATFAMSL